MADEDRMSLDRILSDDKPPPREPRAEAPVEDPKEAPAPEAVAEAPEPKTERPQSRKNAWRDREQDAQGRVRDPSTGQFVSKVSQETKAEPSPVAKEDPKAEPAKAEAPKAQVSAPQQDMTEKEKGLLRAAMEERNKRQAAERERDELRAKMPQEPAKTFCDDPDARLAAHEQSVRAEATKARLGMAEFVARQKHPDFDEKIAEFHKIIQQTPSVAQHWLGAPDPAEYAYQLGKNHLELQQVGSIEELRAKIERETAARVRAEVEAEIKAKAEAAAKNRADLTPSLSQARATGPNTRPVWGGPTALEDILKG